MRLFRLSNRRSSHAHRVPATSVESLNIHSIVYNFISHLSLRPPLGLPNGTITMSTLPSSILRDQTYCHFSDLGFHHMSEEVPMFNQVHQVAAVASIHE